MNKLITITGPSCSGKTTLLNQLTTSPEFTGIVSHTTRPCRLGEVNGKDYYFTNSMDFNVMLQENTLMEQVTFNGYSYGISIDEVIKARESGKVPVVIVEPNGLRQIHNYCDDNSIHLRSIYIDGNPETLIARYLERQGDLRGTESFSNSARRIYSLVKEQEYWRSEFSSIRPYGSIYFAEMNQYNINDSITYIKDRFLK